MQTITQTFVAAVTTVFDIRGKYFTILATNLGLNVRFYKGAKKFDLGDIKGLLAGLEVAFDKDDYFDRVEIDTLGADTFTIGISNGQSRYNRSQGNVTITNGTITGITNNVNVLEQPQVYGASYKSTTLMAANTPDTVFTGATNVNGAIIHAANWAASSGTNTFGCYIAKATAPTSNIDGDVIIGLDNFSFVGATSLGCGEIKKPIKIPAGKGLFYISSSADAAAFRSVLYTLL